MRTPLSGINILNLTPSLPATLATARLHQLGASVIKIESQAGDPLQSASNAWYKALTRGQRIITLDLKNADGQKELNSLLKKTNIMLAAMRPRAMTKLSLSWNSLHRKFPRLSLVRIVGYPAPFENLPGHDLTYQAMAGLVLPPRLPPTLLADFAGAEQAVSSTLLALLQRDRKGMCLSVALSEAASQFTLSKHYGLTTRGALLGGGSPRYNLYQTRDKKWIALAALEDRFWAELIRTLKPKTQTYKALKQIFLTRTAKAWEIWARKQDIPLTAMSF
ncbi:MAG: CoA transferase [Bdellovibrionota bacterium]